MFAPKTGKQGTKGDKLIHVDNISTIAFYHKWCIASLLVGVAVCVSPWFSCTYWDYFWCLFFTVCNFSSWYFMKYIAKATLNPTDGSLIHPGGDVNCPGSIGDTMKDVVITTSIVQVLTALLSNYLALIWTVVPARAFYLLWVHILQPYFMSSSPGADGGDSGSNKKQKKQKIKVVNSRR